MANKILVARGTKARIEEIKSTLATNELVYSTDTGELGVKKANGNIEYFMNAVDIDASKQDKLIAGDNISIVGNTISASVAWQDVENKPELYNKTEINSMLDDKVDKVSGMGLSSNDFTTTEKNKLSGIQAGAQVNEVNSVNGKQGVVVLNQDDIGDGATYKRVSQVEKNTWNEKQDKLVAGNNITIDENNVIEVDLNAMSYFDYAGRIYGDKYSLLVSAWEHSLTVNVVDKDHYPNGETEGVIIPQGVTSIGSNAFGGWSSNNQPLVIPNSVTSIDNYAFYGWTSNNKPLIIPNSVTSIRHYAFLDWSSVPYVEMRAITPPTIASSYVFDGQNDAPIYVPDESVDDYKAATNWVNLADRIFPISDRLVGESGVDLNAMAYFNYASRFYGDKYSLLVSAWEHSLTVDPLEISENSSLTGKRGTAQYPNGEIEGVIIPQGVTSIGNNAFGSWSSNNQPLVIPNSVTSIGVNAFSLWNSNTHPLVIPNSVTSIGGSAFWYWKSNTHPIVIPSSVTSIEGYAFQNWSLVPYVEIQAITPPSLANADAFAGQNNAPIYVPDESVDDYKAATNWVDLADRIFPISNKGNTYTKGEIDLMIGDIESALDAILGV